MTDLQIPTESELRHLAYELGSDIRDALGLHTEKVWKADETPLTQTDEAVNRAVIEWVKQNYPHAGVIGEEESHHVEGARVTFLCDPIDGTIPFTMGLGVSTFVLTVLVDNIPVRAVIYDPFHKRAWTGADGVAYLNGSTDQIGVSTHSEMHLARAGVTCWHGSPYDMYAIMGDLMPAGVKWLDPKSLAITGGLVASGVLEATLFPSNKTWETAAMQVIVEAAGGRVTDLYGQRIDYTHHDRMRGSLVSNGTALHDQLLELIAPHLPPL